MLLAYGHASIKWQGEEYRLAPTFANIAKIGTPTEIIDDFKSFISTGDILRKFNIALYVINACSDKEIPEELTGRVHYSDWKHKFLYVKPAHDLPMISDVITLAEHCFLHGICGKSDNKGNKGKGDPIDSFDAYEFMELARIHLKLSSEEASNMTMTEFVRLKDAESPPENSGEITHEESENIFNWLQEKNKVH